MLNGAKIITTQEKTWDEDATQSAIVHGQLYDPLASVSDAWTPGMATHFLVQSWTWTRMS